MPKYNYLVRMIFSLNGDDFVTDLYFYEKSISAVMDRVIQEQSIQDYEHQFPGSVLKLITISPKK